MLPTAATAPAVHSILQHSVNLFKCVLTLYSGFHSTYNAPINLPVLNWRCWLTQVVPYNGCMTIHLGRVSTYPCFILYTVSKRDQTNDIHLSRLSI